MKYQAVINLWQAGVQQAIEQGRLKLQPGQWCRCGKTSTLCRYVTHTTSGINVVHWQGTPKATHALFTRRIALQHLYY